MKEPKEKYDWRYENSITSKGPQLELGIAGDPKYDAFRTNRSLSNYQDCVAYAQMMNQNYHLDHKLQYDFLYNVVRKYKRPFVKARAKKGKDGDFKLVQEYYKYSNKKTHEALSVLTDEQLAVIRRKMDKGGIK